VLPTDPNNLGGTDLYLMNVDGSGQTLVRSHGQPDTNFVDPGWAADAKALYASLRAPIMVGGQAVGTSMTIVRVPLNGSEPTSITSGESPTASPDGKALAFVTTDTTGISHLWVGLPDGSDAQEPLANRGFTLVQEPRFSPDSKRVAFAAVGGPTTARRGGDTAADALLALILPGVAEADGTPMDFWTVAIDGSDLRRLTRAQDHSPFPAWSPDGRWLAVAGELSLTMVAASGTGAQQLSSNAKATGVVWL
jgi:Tol biopolymer transport system component